jgi:hypothetical protein
MGEITAWADRLGGVLADRDELHHAVGLAAKTAATTAITEDLGPDRAFSGLARRAILSAGYEVGADHIILELRPGGLWHLADRGRRRTSRIFPKSSGRGRRRAQRQGRNGRPPALFFGGRYSTFSRSTPTPGFGTLDRFETDLDRVVPRAIAGHLDKAFNR